MSKDIPIITGVQHRHEYRPGDIVNLTCISRAKPAPKLNFMVNDEEVRGWIDQSRTKLMPITIIKLIRKLFIFTINTIFIFFLFFFICTLIFILEQGQSNSSKQISNISTQWWILCLKIGPKI